MALTLTDAQILEISQRFHYKDTLVKWALSNGVIGHRYVVERLQQIGTSPVSSHLHLTSHLFLTLIYTHAHFPILFAL